MPAGARLSIRNVNGPIEVRPGTTDRVEVQAVYRLDSRARPGDITFEVRDSAGNDVEICSIDRGQNACAAAEDMWSDNHVSVRYLVDLPKGMRFHAFTGNGSIIVMQSVIDAYVQTGSGDVVVRESESRVSAITGNGDVTVAMAFGPVSARTGNGDVLVNMSYGRIDASSGNGDVQARLLSVNPQQDSTAMSISSGNGDIHLTLPADFNGLLNADTGNGKVSAEFDVRATRSDKSRLRGTVGNGNGPVINVHSGNGRVEIRKG
jgi:DUF4097 and DUF4098 domain-containing protein YvlB